MNNTLIVRNIISEPTDGYVRVTLNNELFNMVRGARPQLPYTAKGDMGGNGVRIFSIDGVDLFVSYDKATFKNIFVLKEEDAKSHLLTLADQRAGEEKLPFDTASFKTLATA